MVKKIAQIAIIVGIGFLAQSGTEVQPLVTIGIGAGTFIAALIGVFKK